MKEDELKDLIKKSKIKHAEGFKDRIMHQIEMEKGLTPNREKIKKSRFPETSFAIFVIMYGLIFATGFFLHLRTQENLLDSSLFLKLTILIAAISGVYYLISVFDDSLGSGKLRTR